MGETEIGRPIPNIQKVGGHMEDKRKCRLCGRIINREHKGHYCDRVPGSQFSSKNSYVPYDNDNFMLSLVISQATGIPVGPDMTGAMVGAMLHEDNLPSQEFTPSDPTPDPSPSYDPTPSIPDAPSFDSGSSFDSGGSSFDSGGGSFD